MRQNTYEHLMHNNHIGQPTTNYAPNPFPKQPLSSLDNLTKLLTNGNLSKVGNLLSGFMNKPAPLSVNNTQPKNLSELNAYPQRINFNSDTNSQRSQNLDTHTTTTTTNNFSSNPTNAPASPSQAPSMPASLPVSSVPNNSLVNPNLEGADAVGGFQQTTDFPTTNPQFSVENILNIKNNIKDKNNSLSNNRERAIQQMQLHNDYLKSIKK